MEWWQVVLILVATTVLGVCIGILLYYLYLRFILKRDASLLSTLTLLFSPKKLKTRPVVEEQQIVVEEQQNLMAPDLLAEIEHNCNIASHPLGEKLLPLETRVWDGQQHEVNKLPTKLRDELQQVYNDIDLVNTLVWLSTKLGRRSPHSDKSYMMLCSIIVQRLNIVKKTGQVKEEGVKIEAGEILGEGQEGD